MTVSGRCPVFPIPPFQEVGLVPCMRSEIYRAAINVEQAGIDARAELCAHSGVEPFGIFSLEVAHLANTKIIEVFGDALADTRNDLQTLEDFVFR